VKTAIFGGTFNPVHIGHLIIADEVLAQTDCETVLFVPANIPPHKEVADPGASLRLQMLRKSIEDNPRLCVSDCEISRSGISYSIDTIRHLVGSGITEPNPFLIIGDDLLEGFESWREYESILHESSLIVVHRRSAERVSVRFPHLYVENELFPISSTIIRTKIRENMAWRYLVPDAARKVIEEHRLYGLQKA
jgi:nicotinate-nucleotide adenylyltransferase